MTTRRKHARRRRAPAPAAGAASLKAANARLNACRRRIEALEAQLSRLEEARAGEREANRRRMARVRRQFEDRLTAMVQEIGQLRHHEARARSLEQTLVTRAHEASRLSALLKGRSVSPKSR